MAIEQISEAHLTVSEARLSSVLDIAVDGIVVIDEQATILIFNKACERLFGWSAQEAIGRSLGSMLAPEEASRVEASADKAWIRTLIGQAVEVKARRCDGQDVPVELSIGEASTPDGRQFIGILRDLRPRKEAEQRLNDLQTDLLHMARVSAIDEMGAALAHELNQPLTAVMLYLQAVARTHEKAIEAHSQGEVAAHFDAAVSSILEKARRETERAGHIIQSMRQFIQKREPDRRLIDLAPLADEAIELTMLGYRSHARIERRYSEDLPAVLVDAVQIQQIVVNLLRNALDAVRTIPDARIWVETEATDGVVRLMVRDSGSGVPASALPHLFKAFASTKRSGLGLGLAISRTIAQNHGGELTVDAGGDGRGACFCLTLPDPRDAGSPLPMPPLAVLRPDPSNPVTQ
jgi:two-component system sensor kinase FixL